MIATVFLLAATYAADATPIPVDVAEPATLWLLQQASKSRITCLSINGRDPAADLQVRLQATASWLPASECRYAQTENRSSEVLTADGKPATFLYLSGFALWNESRVSISYKWRERSWSGHGSTLDLNNVGGKWQVDTSQPTYQSVE